MKVNKGEVVSYSEWGFTVEKLDEETVKQYALDEYNKLDKAIGSEWLIFARAVSDDESSYDDTNMYNLLSCLGYDDENIMITACDKILQLFANLQAVIKEKTNIEISLFASTADLMNCDVSEDEYFFTVENYMIRNPDLPTDIEKHINMKNIVQGG